MKFIGAGIPTSLIRCTISCQDKGVETKIRLLEDLFFPIMPGFHKMMHIAAIAPFPNFLAKVIDMGYLYTIDSEGNTPLSYALENNNSECISIILNRFEKHSFLVTCKDVHLLLQSKHPGMHYLFRHCCFNYTYLNATP